MKSRFIITYDISDPARLRKVFKKMTGAGTHIQLSVFRCDLSPRQRELLVTSLAEIIKPSEDQVLFIELGPSDGHAAERITSLGKPYREADPEAVIV